MPDQWEVQSEKPAPTGAWEVASEKPAPLPSTMDRLNSYAGKALSVAGLPTSLANIPDWAAHFVGAADDSKPFWASAQEAYKNPTQENIVGAVPFVGPSAVSMSKDVRAGKYGDAAATLAGTVAAPFAANEVGPGMRAGKAELAEATRLPNNKLNAGTKLAARVGGALVGHATGVPGGGELAGAFLGPSAADAFLPNRPPQPSVFGAYEDPNPALGTPENPAYHSKLPTRLPPNLRGDPFSPTPPAYQSPLGDIPSEEGVAGSVPKPSGRLILLPQEAAAQDQLQSIAKARASQHGMLYAAGMRPAGGGRVPMTPTGIVTTEYPGPRTEVDPDSAYAPPSSLQGNPSPFSPPEEDLATVPARLRRSPYSPAPRTP